MNRKRCISQSTTNMKRYASRILSRTRYTLVHIYAKAMSFIKTSQMKSPVQYLDYAPDISLVIALGIGMYTQWIFTTEAAIPIMAFLGLVCCIVCFALRFYCHVEHLESSLFHLWSGCLMGILTFIYKADLEYVMTEKVMEAFFVLSIVLACIMYSFDKIFKWTEIKTRLLSPSEGLECVGFIISSLFTGHDSIALVLFSVALLFHLSAVRLKSFLGLLSFVAFILVGIFLFFPALNVKVNVFVLSCFLGRQTVIPLMDLYFCDSSMMDRWRIYFNQSGLLQYSFLLILCVLELTTFIVVGCQSTKHKEWFIVFPLFIALAILWLCFHLLHFLTCWRLLGKLTECNSNAHDGTSFNRVMAAKGLRNFALLSQGIVLISLMTTVLVFVIGFETRTPYSLALIFMVLPMEASSLSLFWYLGNSLGGICCGYGIIAPVTSLRPNKGATLLTTSDVENIELRGMTTLGCLQQFFTYHMVQNFGCDYSTSGLEGDNLYKKLCCFFESVTPDGPRYDTYFLYYNGDVYDNGDWALADGNRLGLSTLLKWWHEKSEATGSRLIIVLDCLHSYQWLSSLPRKADHFVAIQTCRYINRPDPETGKNFKVGDFTHTFVQFNTNQEPTLDWHSQNRSMQALYQVSRQWTDFTLHFPTRQEIENHWSSTLPRSLRCLMKLLALTSYSSSLCCFQCVSSWFRYLQMVCLPPKQLDTGHGYYLVRS